MSWPSSIARLIIATTANFTRPCMIVKKVRQKERMKRKIFFFMIGVYLFNIYGFIHSRAKVRRKNENTKENAEKTRDFF